MLSAIRMNAAGFVGGVALLCAACGPSPLERGFFDRNPCSGKADWVCNAKPGIYKPETKQLKSEDIVIAPDHSFFSFSENIEAQYKIHANVLVDGFTYTVNVVNAEEFPNAKFEQDGKVWTFTWKPEPGFVHNSEYLETALSIELVATHPTSAVPQREIRQIPVRVTGQRAAPVFVKQVGFPTAFVREDKQYNFEVHYRDMDKGPARAPQLKLEARGNVGWDKVDLSGFCEIGNAVQDSTDPTLWKYPIKINLSDRNLVKDHPLTGIVRVIAVSRANLVSTVQEMTVLVYPKVGQPVATVAADEEIQVKVGSRFTRDVFFVDPAGKGRVEAIVEQAPSHSGVFIECKTGGWSMPFAANCMIQWDVSASEADGVTYDLKLKATNKSPISGDTAESSLSLPFKLKVVK